MCRRLHYYLAGSCLMLILTLLIGISPEGRRNLEDSILNLVSISLPGNTGNFSFPTDEMKAITRAEACNLAIAVFIQENSSEVAEEKWITANDQQSRYLMIRDYLAFAPETFSDYQPDGFEINLPQDYKDRTVLYDQRGKYISY